ncbi:MAG: hypothetical protein K6E59_00410 [Bacilli bacterium]|nr:hypothetical protein [Bacilli bacterium]
MVPTLIISILTFLLITLSILFFPTIRIGKVRLGTYWIIALIGAVILLCFSLAPIGEVWKELTSDSSVNPLKIIILFFSMTLLSVFLDEVGLFKHLAIVAAKKANKNQYTLFTVLYLLTATLTVFTSNDIVILTFTPFICFFCKNSKINPIPYLVAEFAAANTWSLMLIIGNPTNIYLATSAHIGFFEYFQVMALPTLAAGIVEFSLLFILFRKKLSEPLQPCEEECPIQNKVALVLGLIHLVTCLVFLIISSYINAPMWIIAAICATSLLLSATLMCVFTKKDWNYVGNSLKKLPYQLIPFFLSMFVIVVALNYQGISHKIAEFLGTSNVIWTYGFSSFFVSNLINNIPMSILYSDLCANPVATYAAIVGSNIGAFLTPTGALAGIMFTHLVNEHETKYTFGDFIKYGAIVSLPIIATALLVLSFSSNLFA